MKILYHHRTASKDGMAVHIEEMLHAWRTLGHDVIVVAPPSYGQADFGSSGGLVARLKRLLPRFAYELLELAYSVPEYLRLRRAQRQHQPDALYERHNLYTLSGAWLHWRTGLPFLLEVNAPIAAERTANDGLALGALARLSEHWVWRRADRVLPVTAVLGGIIQAAGVPAERVLVVPNGINEAAFAGAPDTLTAKRRLGLDGRTVLGFTGFVRAWHRLDRVVEFLQRSGRANLLLLVVGDGPERAALEAQAARLGVADRVRFTGVVPRDQMAAHIAAFDVALQPAATPYASPLKLFEYLYLGRAIIAPGQPNLREVLDDGANALLFPPGDPEAFIAALQRLVDDPALRDRLGAAARATIDRRGLRWTDNAQKIVAEIARLRAARRLPAAAPTLDVKEERNGSI